MCSRILRRVDGTLSSAACIAVVISTSIGRRIQVDTIKQCNTCFSFRTPVWWSQYTHPLWSRCTGGSSWHHREPHSSPVLPEDLVSPSPVLLLLEAGG